MFRVRSFVVRGLVVFALLAVMAASLEAQVSNATGNIQGTITDPTGAVVPEASVTILNKATGRTIDSTSTSSGVYTSGSLVPGLYTVRSEAKGFQTTELTLTVQVGTTSGGNVKLAVRTSDETMEVKGEEIRVNTEQATVQGVVTREQIENLPINGRNFLDLAQLEPGVQIQDGGNFDPTKNGFSSISFGGRLGRTARIEVDGVDISDETVGTTTQNIPASSIEQFQVGQSSLDLSTELTSSGSVNVATRSGTNQLHGQGYYYFRDHRIGAKLPTDSPYQRHQFGGSLGGALVKDKVFFFVDSERIKQNLSPAGLVFGKFGANYNAPFRDTQLFGKLDWQIKPDNFKFFYRFSYEQSRDNASYLPVSYQVFANSSHTPVHALGLDFNTGAYTHSIRVSYMKFRNAISDATKGLAVNPAPNLEIAIGNDPFCLTPGLDVFCSGPSYLAPQTTFQSNKQFKYDGSRTFKSHIFRFGGGFNRIQGGGTANFLGLAPAVNAVASGETNPLNYTADTVILGNGQGLSTDLKAFGLPGGGLGPDNRISLYFGDTWKFRSNLTVTGGIRYQRDTGRTDSDVAPAPCSELDPGLAANLAAGGTPCTGNILDLFGSGLGRRVRQPNTNFGPQAGLTWDPFKDGRTVIRAGAGIYYENSIWNNILYDRPARLQKGLFNGSQTACSGGAAQTFSLPDGTVVTPTFCGQPIGAVADQIAALQQQYQAATIAAGPAVNGGFIGNSLTSGLNVSGTELFAPAYKTPRSLQINVGVQRQLGTNTVLTVDYLRNVSTHTLLGIDVNHVGDANFLNVANGLAAINATGAQYGCAPAAATGSASQAEVNCILAAPGSTADITTFAANGLDSGTFACFGGPCPQATFPGVNRNLGVNEVQFPIGYSKYTGLQFSFKQNVAHPFRYVQRMNLVASYSLSKYIASARDGDFINPALDSNHPLRSIGPEGLDRRHQISFGGTAEMPWHFRLGVVSHFYSPLPLDLTVPASGNVGGIFTSDLTGDGTGDGSVVSPGGDLLPGTKLGAFGRSINSIAALDKAIAAYNLNRARFPTPAGFALINAGLVTQNQLVALGAVAQPIENTQTGAVTQAWLRSFDLSLAWSYKPIESVTIEPNISVFNVLNLANFNGPNQLLGGILDGNVGSVNGPGGHGGDRTGLGTGVFALGAPRAIEFGLKITF